MVRGALLAALALLALPASAQQADPPPARPAPPVLVAPPPPVRPMLAPSHPQRATAQSVKSVDIPQWAKDKGHNGTAIYTATVGPDGKLVALVLKQSSMSPAIDEAVKARAQQLYFIPATDKDGNRIEGTVDVAMAYARHDRNSPGGGIETYTCGDLVREYDWFTAANKGRRKLFWPENAYISMSGLAPLLAGEPYSPEAMQASRKERAAMWAKLVKRCRKTPARLMLEEVDRPAYYAMLVNSF